MQELPSAQIKTMRLDAGRGPASDPFAFLPQQAHFQRVHDGQRDLVLDTEDVVDLVVVGIRPQMKSVIGLDELRSDPYPVSRLADAALQQMFDA